MTGHPQRHQLAFPLDIVCACQAGVEGVDRLPADVYLAADRVLDGGVVGVLIDQIVRAALGNQADVAVDGLGDVFSTRRGSQRYRGASRAAANASTVVTGRSQTRPRHT